MKIEFWEHLKFVEVPLEIKSEAFSENAIKNYSKIVFMMFKKQEG